MAPPITRREQVQLDELLSDIYRGIETLPDKSRGVLTTAYDISSSSSAAYPNHQQAAASNQHLIGVDPASKTPPIFGRAYVREYELPESAPLVRQHRQELAALRGAGATETGGAPDYTTSAPPDNNNRPQPARSTLKRHTPTATGEPHQSLAAFLTQPRAASTRPSTTPDGKRRVRIVDPPATSGRASASYNQDENFDPSGRLGGANARHQHANNKKEKVKYVNTNKFIYHQEREADENDQDNNNQDELDYDQTNDDDYPAARDNRSRPGADDNLDDDDIDGVTRVEYYHTSWLDRQLGRASKRRSSKELNERQVKEKAMIEELKRSLKNGAITLRQSFKGKRNSNNNNNNKHTTESEAIFDDQILNSHSNNNHHRQHPNKRVKDSSVFGSGLATLPRNYSSHHHHKNTHKQQAANNSGSVRAFDDFSLPTSINKQKLNWSKGSYYKEPVELQLDQTKPPEQTNTRHQTAISQPMNSTNIAQQPGDYRSVSSYHSRPALSPNSGDKHQLLQAHYRGQKNLTSQAQEHRSPFNTLQPQSNLQKQLQQQSVSHYEMKHPAYNQANASNCANPTQAHGSMGSPNMSHQQHQQPKQGLGNTISSIPSATEVVRSALSRSNSQISLNQLNKTINLLPNSPPPYAPSPMTPTQQLKAASPSLSPSPVRSPSCSESQHRQYSSKTLGHQPSSAQQQQQRLYQPGQIVLHGTRTIGRPPQQASSPVTSGQQHQHQQPQQQQHQQPQQLQQPVYANPHTSLMQHRMEQQMRQPNRNAASIREFNELDSLLRSLSPGSATATTHITPGYTSKPGQTTIGGYMPSSGQQNTYSAAQAPRSNVSDIYARVQKPTDHQSQQQQQQQYQPSRGWAKQDNANPGPAFNQPQPYVIDVTDKKADENCQQRQDLSDFEPPIDLLPSMEDYQNITKLNPVKNHYWYKPFMARDKAINLLRDKPQGTFIVRDSTSHKGAFGLAVKVSKLPKNVLNNANLRNTNGDPSAEYIRHFLIEPTSNGVRLSGYKDEPVFDNLPDLIYQHSLTQIALPCRLVIPRADIEDPRFNQKQKQFYDEFIASKEQAKHMPYERTSPDGGYRKYPGDVLVHNEHRIIFQ